MDSEPNKFGSRDIVMFGSDSEGGRYVIAIDSDEICYLPTGAVSKDRNYLGVPELLEGGMKGFVAFLRNKVLIA